MSETNFIEQSGKWEEAEPQHSIIGDDVLFSHKMYVGMTTDGERECISIVFYFNDLSQNKLERKVALQFSKRENAIEFADKIYEYANRLT